MDEVPIAATVIANQSYSYIVSTKYDLFMQKLCNYLIRMKIDEV